MIQIQVNKSVISSLENIDRQHKLSVLVPVVNFWWHENSRKLMTCYLDRIIIDIRTINKSDLEKHTKSLEKSDLCSSFLAKNVEFYKRELFSQNNPSLLKFIAFNSDHNIII